MISLKINDNKFFMNTLLSSEVFDIFTLKEASLTTYLSINIDGAKPENEENATTQYVTFSVAKKLLFDCLRGKKLPQKFKIILAMNDSDFKKLSQDNSLDSSPVSNYQLTINYIEDSINIISGIAYSSFSLEKIYEKNWDNFTLSFLEKNDIKYTEL